MQWERLEEEIEVTKNPYNVGVWRNAHSPHLAELTVRCSAGIGTLPAK